MITDEQAGRWLLRYLRVARDEPEDWTCWLELPLMPYRSRTENARELLDALFQRFPA